MLHLLSPYPPAYRKLYGLPVTAVLMHGNCNPSESIDLPPAQSGRLLSLRREELCFTASACSDSSFTRFAPFRLW
ncbi:hypothetical protein EB796_007127 [Bugula neritina]|uniref:Uncharacterized protein n=1 Tax=Bugula neritina TaxID=10212 RepID=A0A7J7K7G6_BUGNE|nr:hypothetical protein EB796_007127 [Bugula neritina]